MDTLRRITILATTLTLALGMGSIASAGPDCTRHPDNPHCSSTPPLPEHPDGLTCAEAGFDAVTLTDGTGSDSIAVGKDQVCIDWTTTTATEWVVTAIDPGTARGIALSVRDSHPGDHCWSGVIDLRSGQTSTTISYTMGPDATGGELPISVQDACGSEYTDIADSYVVIAYVTGKPATALMTIHPAG